MVFTSQIFLFWFLPAVLLAYYVVPTRMRLLVLLAGSYVFYGWWRYDFLVLIIGSTIVDFACGGQIARLHDRGNGSESEARMVRRRQRQLVAASVCVNLGLLAYFKYANFGIGAFNSVLASMGFDQVEWTKIVLPVGISFYTFQTMSYTIDVYRRHAPPVRGILDFAAYVALFPQLVAGPIVRYRSIAHQLRERTHSFSRFSTGALLFQMGLAKKVLIADTVGPIADLAFADAAPGGAVAWVGVLAYSLQIYFDFSGYSDMALGLGRMFGFVFPVNFDSPYKSRSILEFWRRWHITLGAWLRDYLYIPLGGNRKSRFRNGMNLFVTMVLGGLWHGAAWTFLIWGVWHGVWLVIERVLGGRPFYARAPGFVRTIFTFLIVLGGWVFFRADSLSQAMGFLGAMVGLGDVGWSGTSLTWDYLQLAAGVAGFALVWTTRPSQQLADRPPRWLPIIVSVAFVLAVVAVLYRSHTPFLYFQF